MYRSKNEDRYSRDGQWNENRYSRGGRWNENRYSRGGRWNEDCYSRGGWRNEVSQYALYNRAVRVAINVRGNSNIEEWPRGTLVSNVLSKLDRSLPS